MAGHRGCRGHKVRRGHSRSRRRSWYGERRGDHNGCWSGRDSRDERQSCRSGGSSPDSRRQNRESCGSPASSRDGSCESGGRSKEMASSRGRHGRYRHRRRHGPPPPHGQPSPGEEECGGKSSSRHGRRQERHEHLHWRPGLRLGEDRRYSVEELLGDGATGRVLLCRDGASEALVAVKVAKANRRQERQALAEAEVLRRLEGQDAALCRRFCVRLLGTFTHGRHVCLAFEPLALSLRGLLRAGGGRGLLLADVQRMARQLLGCLRFLHAAGLAHADLKCTNVMLRDGAFDAAPHPRHPQPQEAPRMRRPCEVVVIDFGGAAVPGEQHRNRLGARHVRAPEVVLGLNWDVSADLWGLGCLLSTLYTGDRLFRVHDDMTHLAMMERVLEARIPGAMGALVPDRILAKGVRFDAEGRLAWPPGLCRGADGDRGGCGRAAARVRRAPALRELVLPRHDAFLRLLRGLLEIRPRDRLTADAALRTPFVSDANVVE